MMNKIVILLTICVWQFIVSAENKLEANDAKQAFQQDIRNNEVQFLATVGIATVYPGIGNITKLFCFNDIPSRAVSNRGDEVASDLTFDEEFALRKKIYHYAYEYNKLTLKYLKNQGRSQCPEHEKWDDAFRDISGPMANTNLRNKYRLRFDFGNEIELELAVYEEAAIEAIKTMVCSSLKTNGIIRRIPITLSVEPNSDVRRKETMFCDHCQDHSK